MGWEVLLRVLAAIFKATSPAPHQNEIVLVREGKKSATQPSVTLRARPHNERPGQGRLDTEDESRNDTIRAAPASRPRTPGGGLSSAVAPAAETAAVLSHSLHVVFLVAPARRKQSPRASIPPPTANSLASKRTEPQRRQTNACVA